MLAVDRQCPSTWFSSLAGCRRDRVGVVKGEYGLSTYLSSRIAMRAIRFLTSEPDRIRLRRDT